MHLIPILTLIALCGLLFTSWVASRPRGRQLAPLANIGEGAQPAVKTYLTDAAITTRYLLGKVGTDSAHVAVCGATDIPLGVIADEAPAAEEGVAVQLFGMHESCAMAVASAAIAADAFIVAAASGKVRTLPGTTGTYFIIGRALKAAAADGDIVEFVPCFPIQRVVP